MFNVTARISWTMPAVLAAIVLLRQGLVSAEEEKCGQPDTEIRSGILLNENCGLSSDGSLTGQKRSRRIWFEHDNTREDSYIEDILTESHVPGWMSFPAVGRILDLRRSPYPQSPYPKETRDSFAKRFANRESLGTEVLHGLVCSRYAWHEEDKRIGCMNVSAYDEVCWVYTSRELPVVMKSEVTHSDGFGNRNEITSIELNCAIPAGTFEPPTGLKAIQPFVLPERRCEIKTRYRRISKKYGWTSDEVTTLVGNGKSVLSNTEIEVVEANGKTNKTQNSRVCSYAEARNSLQYFFGFDHWPYSKKTGERELMGMPSDIVEGIVEQATPSKSWVVDHPIMGTIRMRWEYGNGVETELHEVTRLVFPE